MKGRNRIQLTIFITLLFAVCIGLGFVFGYDYGDRLEVREVWQPVVVEASVEAPTAPAFDVYSTTQPDLKKELRKYTGCDFHYLDETYYYTDKTTVSDLLVSIEIPEFTAETWDCDDIALYVKAEMARLYGLNCVGYAEGGHFGYSHAWNVVLTSEGVFTWEGELQQWNNESWYDANLIWF